jgi:hypothetical protein
MAILANNSVELHQKKIGYQKRIEKLQLSVSTCLKDTGFLFLTAEVKL